MARRLGLSVWPQPWEGLTHKAGLLFRLEPGSHRNSLSPPCSVSGSWSHLPMGKGHQMPKERCLLAPFLHQNSSLKRSLRQPFAFFEAPFSSLCCVRLPTSLSPACPGSITAFLCAPQGRWCPQEAPDQKRSGGGRVVWRWWRGAHRPLLHP